MRRGPIPLLMHASIEPIAAVLLIASSWIFGFSNNGMAQALTIIIGIVMLASGAMTDWRLALARLIPLRAHFMTDLVLGAVLVVSPFVFWVQQQRCCNAFRHHLRSVRARNCARHTLGAAGRGDGDAPTRHRDARGALTASFARRGRRVAPHWCSACATPASPRAVT